MRSKIKAAQVEVNNQLSQKIEDVGCFQNMTKHSAKEISSLIQDMANINGLFEEVDRLERKIDGLCLDSSHRKEISVTVTCPSCGNRKWVEGAFHKIFRVKSFCSKCGQRDILLAEDNHTGVKVPLDHFQAAH